MNVNQNGTNSLCAYSQSSSANQAQSGAVTSMSSEGHLANTDTVRGNREQRITTQSGRSAVAIRQQTPNVVRLLLSNRSIGGVVTSYFDQPLQAKLFIDASYVSSNDEPFATELRRSLLLGTHSSNSDVQSGTISSLMSAAALNRPGGSWLKQAAQSMLRGVAVQYTPTIRANISEDGRLTRTLARGGEVFNMRFQPSGQRSGEGTPFDMSVYQTNDSPLVEVSSEQGFKSFFPALGRSRIHLESSFLSEEEKGSSLQGTDNLIKHRDNIRQFRSLLCDKMLELGKIESDIETLR